MNLPAAAVSLLDLLPAALLATGAPADAPDAARPAAAETTVAGAAGTADEEAPQTAAAAQPAPPPAPPPAFAAMKKPVFDETWVTLGLGAGLVPSYAGSNNYIVFPLPLIVGRVGGIGIRPNGAGLTFNVLSPKPSFGPRKTRVSFGPAFRLRNDRNVQIEDDVVAAAGKLDNALEVGLDAAVAFPGVFRPLDTLTVGAQVRRDVLGAHDGFVFEPQVSYVSPIGRAVVLQVQSQLEFVDDSFADYYFSVGPVQRNGSGLPLYDADGGLNRVGALAILNYDLSGNALDGGWTIFGVGGYSRLLGDAADSPFVTLRGNPNQFIAGLGLGYTF